MADKAGIGVDMWYRKFCNDKKKKSNFASTRWRKKAGSNFHLSRLRYKRIEHLIQLPSFPF